MKKQSLSNAQAYPHLVMERIRVSTVMHTHTHTLASNHKQTHTPHTCTRRCGNHVAASLSRRSRGSVVDHLHDWNERSEAKHINQGVPQYDQDRHALHTSTTHSTHSQDLNTHKQSPAHPPTCSCAPPPLPLRPPAGQLPRTGPCIKLTIVTKHVSTAKTPPIKPMHRSLLIEFQRSNYTRTLSTHTHMSSAGPQAALAMPWYAPLLLLSSSCRHRHAQTFRHEHT